MPPTSFQTMVNKDLVAEDVLSAIRKVQKQKEVAQENDIIKVAEVIRVWIRHSIQYFEEVESRFLPGNKSNWDELNRMMLEWSV